MRRPDLRGPLRAVMGHAHGHGFGPQRASVPAWVPSDVAGLLLQYDALSTPTMECYLESSGTPPGTTRVTTNGETVGTCRNKVANNDHLIQATAASRPTYNSTGLGGGPCLIFEGSADHLRVVDSVTAAQFTWLISFKLDSVPGSGLFTSPGGINFSAGSSELLLMNGVGGYRNLTVNLGTTNGVGYNMTLDTSPHVVVITYNGGSATSAASWQVFVDGVSQTLSASGLVIPSGAHAMGARTSGSNQMAGRVRAMCAWSGVLSAGDIASATEWGTP